MHATTTSRRRPDAISALIDVGDDLLKAKRRATAYFGNVHPDNDAVIVILQNGEPISKRRAAGGKWKDL